MNNPIPAPLTRTADIRKYILSASIEAVFTLVFKDIKRKYTYRVRKDPENHGNLPVDLATDPKNAPEYRPIGTISHRKHGLEFKSTEEIYAYPYSTAAVGVGYFVWRMNDSKDLDPEKIIFLHDGQCSRCGRPLDTPESAARGMHPICSLRTGEIR